MNIVKEKVYQLVNLNDFDSAKELMTEYLDETSAYEYSVLLSEFSLKDRIKIITNDINYFIFVLKNEEFNSYKEILYPLFKNEVEDVKFKLLHNLSHGDMAGKCYKEGCFAEKELIKEIIVKLDIELSEDPLIKSTRRFIQQDHEVPTKFNFETRKWELIVEKSEETSNYLDLSIFKKFERNLKDHSFLDQAGKANKDFIIALGLVASIGVGIGTVNFEETIKKNKEFNDFFEDKDTEKKSGRFGMNNNRPNSEEKNNLVEYDKYKINTESLVLKSIENAFHQLGEDLEQFKFQGIEFENCKFGIEEIHKTSKALVLNLHIGQAYVNVNINNISFDEQEGVDYEYSVSGYSRAETLSNNGKILFGFCGLKGAGKFDEKVTKDIVLNIKTALEEKKNSNVVKKFLSAGKTSILKIKPENN